MNKLTPQCNTNATPIYPNCLTSLATISEHLISIDEKLDTVVADYKQLNKDINLGNGKPPLKERVTLLENNQARRQNIHAWVLGVIALVLAGVLVERIDAHFGSKNNDKNTIEHVQTQ